MTLALIIHTEMVIVEYYFRSFYLEENDEVGPVNMFKPYPHLFHWPFQGGTSAVILFVACF